MLIRLLIRILCGERLRKPTPAEKQNGAVFVFLFPVYLAVFVVIGRQFLDQGSEMAIGIFATVAGSTLFFGTFYLAKVIPAKISWVLAAVTWPLFLLWAWKP